MLSEAIRVENLEVFGWACFQYSPDKSREEERETMISRMTEKGVTVFKPTACQLIFLSKKSKRIKTVSLLLESIKKYEICQEKQYLQIQSKKSELGQENAKRWR